MGSLYGANSLYQTIVSFPQSRCPIPPNRGSDNGFGMGEKWGPACCRVGDGGLRVIGLRTGYAYCWVENRATTLRLRSGTTQGSPLWGGVMRWFLKTGRKMFRPYDGG